MSKRARAAKAVAGSTAMTVRAKYDAAGQGRRMAGWNPPASGPNRAMAGLQTIRNRSRDADRNEWSGASSARVMTTNLIGTGIVARPRTKDAATKSVLAKKWDQWCEVSDADGVLDFYGQQTLAAYTWFTAGEVFARIRPRRLYDGLPAPVQIQLVEPDLVPVFDADSWPGMKAGNYIRSGVEFDRIGRRVAYWMHPEHPGEPMTTAVSINDLVRVPAENVMHVFRPKRPGQVRGVPESAPILAKLRSVMNFDDAVLTRQQIANLFTLFITRPMPTGADAKIDPLTGKTIEYDNNGAPMAALEPGISQELLPGEDVKFSDPPDAGANYADFMRSQLLGTAAGQGTPYELMTGDIKDVSDRTLRVVINEFRRYCEQIQWTILIPMLCKPVRAAWAQYAMLAGVLTAEQAAEARDTVWSPHGWAYIHPVQDVQAKKLEVDEGFRARSSVITERGDDPEAVDQARADDMQREIDLGLAFEPVDPNKPQEPSPQEQAMAARARAEELLLQAKARREQAEGEAVATRELAAAKLALADATLRAAQAEEVSAKAKAILAKSSLDEAEAASRVAELEHRRALAENESAERVKVLHEQAETARAEAQARAEAFSRAEAFAAEQRQLVLDAERRRAECASLEAEAARLGLAELAGA